MELKLSSDAERLVEKKVTSGRYRSAEEVVHTAIYVLDERDQEEQNVEWLRQQIGKAEEQFERGEYRTFSSAGELLEEVRSKGRERLEKTHPHLLDGDV
jgi:putative addiction module CopG family antidote